MRPSGKPGNDKLFGVLPGNSSAALNVGAHSGGKFAKLCGILLGKVGGLERVGFEVEKFPGFHGGIFHELPRAASHRPAGLAHVAEVAFATHPEEITIEGCLLARFEEREDGAAIDSAGEIGPGDLEAGGEEVHGHSLKIRVAGLDDSGPNGTGRNLDAAFIHVLFSAPEITASASDVDLSAVVGDEENEAVLPLLVFLEGGNDFADAIVHVFDEGDEFGALFSDARLAFLHFCEPIFRWLDGGVRSVVGEVEEEGLIGFGRAVVEIAVGPVGENVGGMPFRIDLLLVESHVVLAVATVLVVVIHHVAKKAVEVVEATGVGMFRIIQSEVPFSNGRGMVALLLECFGKHGGGPGKEAPVVRGVGADDAGDADQVWIASGEQ